MASSKIKGITVEIGGDTTKLGDAIKDVEKKSNSLKGELKQVEKLLKMDPGNADLIAQKQEILTRAVAETSEKLDTLKEAQAQVEAQFNNGEIGEDQYRAFQREIIKTENELNGFRKELDGTGDDFEEAGDSAEESSDGFTVMKGALADMVANAITSAVSAIGDLIGSLMELSEATEEYRTMQSKLEGSSETFGYSMDFAKSKYEEFYKYLGDDQASTNAITNLMGIGAETETVSKLADGATAVWASYGDSIPIEGLTEAINETITVGKVTGGMADTINWAKNANEGLNTALSGNKEAQSAFNKALKDGLPVEDAFNEALAKITDEQERADVVAKFLNATYGDSKKAYDDLNKSVMDTNEAELELKDTQAQLGETMAPVNNAITDMKNKALEAIAPLVEKLANSFMDLYNWLQKNPAVMHSLVAVAIALASAFTILAGALAIQGIITGVTKAIAFLNTTILANPIVLIIAAIAGLVAAFIYLWNNCDGFREFWIDLWKKVSKFFVDSWNTVKDFATKTIPEMINKIVSWFKQLPGKIWNFLVMVVTKVVTWRINMIKKAIEVGTKFVSSVVNLIKTLPSKIWTWLKNVVSKVVSWGSDLASKGKQAGKKLLDSVVDMVKGIPKKITSIGKDIVSGLWSGITNKVSWLKDKIKGFVGDVTDWLKKFFKIKSPSRLMRDEIGRYISEGIGVGITENADKPIGALEKLGNDMIDPGINGATINRSLSHTFNGGANNLVNDNASVISKLEGIYERLGRLQMVMDSGALVAEIIDKVDSGLAERQLLSARGV